MRPRVERLTRSLLAGLLVTAGVLCVGSALVSGEDLPPLAAIALWLDGGSFDFGQVDPGEHLAAMPLCLTVFSELDWRLLAAAALPPGVGLDWSADGHLWNTFSTEETVLLDDLPAEEEPVRLQYLLRLRVDWSLAPGVYAFPLTYRAEFTDQRPPTGQISINAGAAYTGSRWVVLTLQADDPSGVGSMRLSSDGQVFGEWLRYAGSHDYQLPEGDGLKQVWVQFRDRAGNVSTAYQAAITLDTVFPVISGVTLQELGPTSATVIWQTDEPASGQVEYGTSPAYGSMFPVPPGPPTQSHAVTLTGLHSATTYYYRVRAVDRAGNESISAQYQLATALLPPVDLTASRRGIHVYLSWQATPSPGPTGYRIWRRNVLQGGEFVNIGQVSGTTLSYSDWHVLQGLATYHFEYRVTAIKTGYPESEPSNVATVRSN